MKYKNLLRAAEKEKKQERNEVIMIELNSLKGFHILNMLLT